MRKELEITEKIERYLTGQLSASERLAFEKEIAADPKLQEEVQLQQEVMKGIERVALKQTAQQAYRKYKSGNNFLKWGLTGLSIVVASAAILYYTSKNDSSSNTQGKHELNAVGEKQLSNSNNPLSGQSSNLNNSQDTNTTSYYAPKNNSYNTKYEKYELNENGGEQWADADKQISGQYFNLNTSKDTVIETDGGIVMAIPANCFLDDNGQPVNGSVELEIKEALDAASIMKAGLSSKSNDKLLESAGMFYVNARKDGKSLKINPANGIYTEVPTKNKRGDMQLFEGKRMPDGTINWINPKPLEKFLTPVDIHSLNFYPPLYLDSLKKWGYNTKDKQFTDSLYYSFASLFSTIKSNSSAYAKKGKSTGKSKKDLSERKDINREELERMKDRGIQESTDTISSRIIYGINPAKIKAIWNDEFQNTLISTREFEKRIQYIHKTCNNDVLDVYVNNMSKNLSAIDSMAAQLLSGESKNIFLSFAASNDGKVKINSTLMNKLKEYYALKTKAITEAVAKTEKDYLEKQAKLEQLANDKRNQNRIDDNNRERKNLQEEYDINITEAYRQLGIKKRATTISTVSKEVYSFTITTTSWKNIDAYVMESTLARTSLNYTSDKGKKVVIKYLPFTVKVKDYSNYDQLYVYLLPDKLNSFMRLTKKQDRFEEKLNELMTYKMVCVAYKNDKMYFTSVDKVKSKVYDEIALLPIDKELLNQKLNALKNTNQLNDMKSEIDYLFVEMGEVKRKKAETDRVNFRYKIMEVIFPCYAGKYDVEKEDRGILDGLDGFD